MNLPVMCQNMYSVEQVELVRRLRTSGLNRDQVLVIWERLDRLDAELNQQQQQQQQSQPVFSSLPAFPPAASREFLQLLQQERHQQANALMMMQMQQLLSSANKQAQQAAAAAAATTATTTTTTTSKSEAAVTASTTENNVPIDTNASQIVAAVNDLLASAATKPEPYDADVPTRLVDENDQELVDFLRKNNEPQICEQIRQFIALNGIKQHQVAVLVGTSQSYISKYLKADYLEMSERSRRNIYRWYVTYRSQPARAISDACAVIANPLLQHSISSSTSSSLPLTAAITPLAVNNNNNSLPLYPVLTNADNNNNNNNNSSGAISPGVGGNVPGSPRSTSSSSVGNGGGNGANPNASSTWNLLPVNGSATNNNSSHGASHRRFRFTFRAQQLAILERAFSEDTYPTVERREELARQLSQGLDGEQAVSLFTVTNWFANRRKEAKRAAVEEGLNVEELGMKRGRGRPSILHRMASAQLRETRQNFNGAGQVPGDGSNMSTAARLNGINNNNNNNSSSADLLSSLAKRARKAASGDDEDIADEDDDQCSLSSGAAADDVSSSSAGNYRQQAADLAVFPTPELIAS